MNREHNQREYRNYTPTTYKWLKTRNVYTVKKIENFKIIRVLIKT